MNILVIVIIFFSGIISGMGVGGGSIFILLTTILNLFEHKEAQGYNLLMFIVVGIASTILNFKNKTIDKNLFKKLIIPVCIGSIIGILITKNIDENLLKKLFYVFMLFRGFYEIISRLKNIIKEKNTNNKK